MASSKSDYILGSDPELEARVAEGSVVVARVTVFKRYANNLCFLRSSRFPCDVIVNSAALRGPAMHGDVVAAELLPREQWQTVQPRKADAKESTEAADDAADAGDEVPAAMPSTLPDGRHITQLIAPETPAEVAQNASAEVSLAVQMNGPATYEWPEKVRPVARVVRILKRRLPLFHVARIAENQVQPGQQLRSTYYYRFRPFNPLYPQLVVRGSDILSTYQPTINNSLFTLALIHDERGELVTPPDMQNVLGCTIHAFLGDSSSVEVANQAICTSCDVRNEPFSDEAQDCILKDFPIPSPEELEKIGRRDLRQTEFVCTIDPATARDLDDALSIRPRKDGGYHVGVHIADVSFFVQPGTALDEEAQVRSNSTYLVDRVIAMLPARLSEQYCSLNPNEDKFAFSGLFEFDRHGDLISEAATGERCEWFGQSVIRSRCRLAYEQAQQILDDDDSVELDVAGAAAYLNVTEAEVRDRVKKSVKDLFKLATQLRKKSMDAGRLVVGNSRLAFRFEQNLVNSPPTAFFVQQQIEANWLVEEFMLFANQRVAQKVVQFIPNGALLRRHKAPSPQKMNRFRAALTQRGLPVGGSTGQELQRVLNTIKADHFSDYYTVCELLKYSLMAAEYLANDPLEKDVRSHFAVAAPWYTHFTSPIRRYCDLMVHRQLQVALELEARMRAEQKEMPTAPDPAVQAKPGEEIFDATHAIDVETLTTKNLYYPQSQVEMIVTQANQCRLNSRSAGDMSLEYFFCLYLLALQKRAKEEPTLPQRIYTKASIVKMTEGSFLLFSSEIASEVEIGFEDTRQRFKYQGLIVTGDADAGAGASAHADPAAKEEKTIDAKAKAHARKKGGKSGMPHSGGSAQGKGGNGREKQSAPVTLAASFSWGSNAAVSEEEVAEVFALFTEFVVMLDVSVKDGRLCLNMMVLPPWEREAALLACPQVPTSLVEVA